MKLKNTLGLVIASFHTCDREGPAFDLVTNMHRILLRVGGVDIHAINHHPRYFDSISPMLYTKHHHMVEGCRPTYTESVSALDSLIQASPAGHANLTSMCRVGSLGHLSGRGDLEASLRDPYVYRGGPSVRWGSYYLGPHVRPSVKRHLRLRSQVEGVDEHITDLMRAEYLNGMTYEDPVFFTSRGSLRVGYMPIIQAKTSQGASMVQYHWADGWLNISRAGKHPAAKEAEELIAKNMRFSKMGAYLPWDNPWFKDYSLIKDREDKMCWNPSKHKTDATKRHYYT
ncbi:hypothetical protein D3C81_305060 [compost metagenome]